MKLEIAKEFCNLIEAVELLPPEPKRQILETLAQVENESDEVLKHTIEAIRTTLGEDFGIIT